MSITYFDDRSVYEKRYDKITVEVCREREQMVYDIFGERPPLDAKGQADAARGYYPYSIFYFQLVESVAGERWQEREETIRQWMATDEAKNRRLADAQPAEMPYCRSCGEDMEIHLRTYHHREHGRVKGDREGHPVHVRL